MDNGTLARAFDELADLVELGGANPFKARAYRAFARDVRGREESIAEIHRRGQLDEMPGVGKAIAGKVEELLRTGSCAALDRARADVPAALVELLRVPGLGATTVRTLWQKLGVTSLGELAQACAENRLAALPQFGPKRQSRTLTAVRFLLEGSGGMMLATAREAGRIIGDALAEAGAKEVSVVGEARRGLEIVLELEVLVRGLSRDRVASALVDAREPLGARSIDTPGGDEVQLALAGGERVSVRVVDDAGWVEALLARTGDDEHVRWLERRAADKGGLRAVARASRNEANVYASLSLPLVPPELRTGASPDVPRDLLGDGALGGIFHVHTDWSDGTASISAMARAASRAGFSFIGISDHSRAASYAHGLDGARLAEQAAAMREARKECSEITIFHGVEVDILADGSLDLDDATLGALDFVIASVHTSLTLPSDEMTARIVRAVSHPLVTILGHPTGRLLLGRRGYAFDVAAVAKAAAANDTCLEINANPNRLDLSDTLIRRAALEGAHFAIDPDAHAPIGVRDAALGVTLARRAGLSRAQVLNAVDAETMRAALSQRKERALLRLAAR